MRPAAADLEPMMNREELPPTELSPMNRRRMSPIPG